MTPGIFARTYASKNPAVLFAQIQRDGYRAAQFNLSCAGLDPLPARLPAGLGKTVCAAANANGLTLCALSGTYNMAHPDPSQRDADRARFLNVLTAAGRHARVFGDPMHRLARRD